MSPPQHTKYHFDFTNKGLEITFATYLVKVRPGWTLSCLFFQKMIAGYFPLFRGREVLGRKVSKHIYSAFTMFFSILVQAHDVPRDRRVIESQKTSGAMITCVIRRASFCPFFLFFASSAEEKVTGCLSFHFALVFCYCKQNILIHLLGMIVGLSAHLAAFTFHWCI